MARGSASGSASGSGSGRVPGLEQLNAYVDGELSAAEASAVARAVFEDRDLARQVAVLTRLKAMVQAGHDDDEAPADLMDWDDARPPAVPAPARTALYPAVVSALALLLFLGGTLAVHLTTVAAEPAWLDAAWSVHQAWAERDPGAGPAAEVAADPAETGALLAGLVRFESPPLIPDLAAARLRLTEARAIEGLGGVEDRQGLHLGYEGTRGCRLSLLLVMPGWSLPERLQRFDHQGRLAAGWRTGAVGHLVLAEGMDPDRFALIAESLREAAIEAAPLDPETRTALAHSRAESQPCMS